MALEQANGRGRARVRTVRYPVADMTIFIDVRKLHLQRS